jgi:hypothetical protein
VYGDRAGDRHGDEAHAAEDTSGFRRERARMARVQDAVFGHDGIADVEAFVTDEISRRARDELKDMLLGLVAE